VGISIGPRQAGRIDRHLVSVDGYHDHASVREEVSAAEVAGVHPSWLLVAMLDLAWGNRTARSICLPGHRRPVDVLPCLDPPETSNARVV
jgi:hypothetical protein